MTKQKSTEDKESNKGSFKDRYKICLSELNKIPTVPIKGKRYSIVAERFRHILTINLMLLVMLKSKEVHLLLMKQVLWKIVPVVVWEDV